MTSRTIIVKGLAPTANFSSIEEIFKMNGHCTIDFKGDYAIVEFLSEDVAIRVVQTLDNKNFFGANPNPVSVQHYNRQLHTQNFGNPASNMQQKNPNFYQTNQQNPGQAVSQGNALYRNSAGQGQGMDHYNPPNAGNRSMQMEREQNMLAGSATQRYTQQLPNNMTQGNMHGEAMGQNIRMQEEINTKSAQDFYNEKYSAYYLA